jgi:hypothetical protein
MSNRDFFASLLENEKDRFAGVIAAVPADKLDWRPEPKARTAGELISHLIAHDRDLEELAATGTCNHGAETPSANLARSLESYGECRDRAVSAVRAASDASWEGPGRSSSTATWFTNSPSSSSPGSSSSTPSITAASSRPICGLWGAQCRRSTAPRPTRLKADPARGDDRVLG